MCRSVELNLPGLRCVPVRRHPHLVFYVERDNHVDVWRVLHGERDIPAWMKSPDNVQCAAGVASDDALNPSAEAGVGVPDATTPPGS